MSNGLTPPMTGTGMPLAGNHEHLADRGTIIRAGIAGGLVGAVSIWIYEALVWVGV